MLTKVKINNKWQLLFIENSSIGLCELHEYTRQSKPIDSDKRNSKGEFKEVKLQHKQSRTVRVIIYKEPSKERQEHERRLNNMPEMM